MKKRRCFPRLIAIIVHAPFPGEWSLSAAILPVYTALLLGGNNGTGVGLAELYDREAPP